MTTINPTVALRRVHQGLQYLIGVESQEPGNTRPESVLAVVTLMAYLGAYAFLATTSTS
jgi:hypothetical protein